MKLGVVAHGDKVLDGGLEALRAELAVHGQADPPWREVGKAKKAAKALKQLVVDEGVDHVLVWGGDGTTRRCIDRIVSDELDCTLGLLPAGTHNLLARNLGIPTDLAEAVRIALTCRPTPIDVGFADGQHFAVTGGIGFDAMMIREVEEGDLKERFGTMSHVIAGIRAADLPPAEAVVTVDGKVIHEGAAGCVLFCNVSTVLGGIDAFPDATADDGQIHVAVISAGSKREWARVVSRAVVGDVADSALVTTASGTDIVVDLDRSLPWELDGSDRGRVNRLAVRCLPAAVGIARPT